MQLRTEKLLRDLRLALSYGAALFCLLAATVFAVIGSAVGAAVFLLLGLYAVPVVRQRLTDYHPAANTTLVVVGVLVFGTFAGAGLGVVTTPDVPQVDPGQQQSTGDPPDQSGQDGRDAATNASGGDASPSGAGGGASPTEPPSPVHPPTRTSTDSGDSPETDTEVRAAGSATRSGSATATPNLTDSIPVQIVEIVDGNTLRVRRDDGSTDTVRLLGVDVPELGGDARPAEWEGVPDTEAARQCLRDEARRADDYVTAHVANETVRLAFDDRAGRRDGAGRLLAYARTTDDDVRINYQLALQGHGRVVDRDFDRRQRFLEAQRDAQNQSFGAWHCREGDRETETATGQEQETADGGANETQSDGANETQSDGANETQTRSADSENGTRTGTAG